MGILTRTIANNLGENPNPGVNFRNFIINGKMIFDRRGGSYTSNGYTLDRWTMDESTDGAVTVSQNGDVPAGTNFSSSLKIDVTTADASIGAAQYCGLTQFIEGQNMVTANYGTSDAENMMLSFWVKSNKTGIYCVRFVKEAGDGTRYETPIEYTISASNTWEKKTISLSPTAGSTALITASAGAIKKDANAGFRIMFSHAVGSNYQATNNTWVAGSDKMGTSNSVNLLDSDSNEWYLTGVQLELGSSPTSFEHLPEDVELLRCQRYYFKVEGGPGQNYMNFGMTGTNGTSSFMFMHFPQSLRGNATISSNGTFSSNVPYGGGYENTSAGPSLGDMGSNMCRIDFTTPTSNAAGLNGRILMLNDGTGYIDFDAEL